jgi:hypothetical protein
MRSSPDAHVCSEARSDWVVSRGVEMTGPTVIGKNTM